MPQPDFFLHGLFSKTYITCAASLKIHHVLWSLKVAPGGSWMWMQVSLPQGQEEFTTHLEMHTLNTLADRAMKKYKNAHAVTCFKHLNLKPNMIDDYGTNKK